MRSTSDERLKASITPAPSATEALKAIEVCSFDWAASGKHVDYGFIAQRLRCQVPQAVSVGGDDARGQPWTVDHSKLVPVLTKALQEALARIDALEARIESLAKPVPRVESKRGRG